MGHGAAIWETARLTGRKIELTEEEKAVLDEKLCLLNDADGETVFTYFLPDERKDGGVYVTTVESIKKLDPLERQIVLTDDTVILVEAILKIVKSSFCKSIYYIMISFYNSEL